MAVDVLGLLGIFRLAVLWAGGRSRCRRPVGLRPLFLSLLGAFRVRTHICLLLVILPPNAGACMAWLYPVHNVRNNVDTGPTPAADRRSDRVAWGGRRPAMP